MKKNKLTFPFIYISLILFLIVSIIIAINVGSVNISGTDYVK